MYQQRNNIMKDPATAAARIYVGNIEPGTVEQEIQEVFQKHGKILRITVLRNFGFIQFEAPESAQAAIQHEMGTLFKGKKLNVRAAITDEGGKGGKQKQGPQQQGGTQQGGQQGSAQQPSDSTPELDDHQGNNQFHRRGNNRGRGGGPNTRGRGARGGRGGGNNGDQQAIRDRSPLNRGPDRASDRDFAGGFNRNREEVVPQNLNREPYAGPQTPIMTTRRKADCNDCEIIVVAKSLTEYAEFIERRLKQCGLTVDLLFPNEDVPIGRVLANIASRGCLYAILVTPQNEEHGSLTLNILYGSPQEHRNMPTEDAINLLSRNFEAYMRGDKNIPGTVTIGSLTERHPEAIQVLLNLLAENRQLTVLQYDRIIKYLQERRELQLKHELGDAAEDMDTSNPSSKQAAELQNRILSILNSKTESGSGNPVPNVVSPPAKPGPTATPAPLLNDPSVQKALDSLLNADLLKNIVKTSSTSNVNSSSNDNYGTSYSANIRRF